MYVRKLHEEQGFSYIFTAVLVLFMATLFSVLLSYLSLMGQVQAEKRLVQASADSFLSDYARVTYDDLKHGTDYVGRLNLMSFESEALSALGFGSDGTSSVTRSFALGEVTRTLSEFETDTDSGIGFTVRYRVTFRIRFLGELRAGPDLILETTARYVLKT